MITVITVFIIVFVVFCVSSELENIKVCIVSSLLVSSVLLFLTFGMWGYDRDMSTDYQVSCDDIYSLGIATEINGSFVLGCGSVDSDAYYTFYTKDSSDLYKMSKLKITGTLIKLDSSQSPKIVKVVRMITKTPCTIFGGDKEGYEYDTGKRILVVPTNTIKQEYKVN